MEIDTTSWSGDGDFTILLLDVLQSLDVISAVRVEDAPASRAGSGYNFLANEIYVTFALERQAVPGRWLGLLPMMRYRVAPRMTLAGLADSLAGHPEVGPPDYADEGMLQYLRAERVVPEHQSRGYKLVEMVRVYATRVAPGRS